MSEQVRAELKKWDQEAIAEGYKDRIGEAALLAHREALSAIHKIPPMQSGHEGWAVIKEELDELWEEVKKYPHAERTSLREEATQIAAMAIRFIADVCPKLGEP
jgi:hypothetical protein